MCGRARLSSDVSEIKIVFGIPPDRPTPPNVIMTPHCSPRTDGTIERRSRDVARNIDRFVRGEPLENVVTTT
jgi:phosphoglycerate dehydrogenase-like enzyme